MQLCSALAGLVFHGDVQEPTRLQCARTMLSYCRGSASHWPERVILRQSPLQDAASLIGQARPSLIAEDLPSPQGVPSRAPSPTYVPSLGPELDENIHELLCAGDGLLVYRMLQLATMPTPAGRTAAVLASYGTGNTTIAEIFGEAQGQDDDHGHDHGHAHRHGHHHGHADNEDDEEDVEGSDDDDEDDAGASDDGSCRRRR